MTKAKRVHSTQPRTASKTKPNPSADESDKRHANAFRDLEGRISDCVTMAWFAMQQVCNAANIEGEAIFAATNTHQMLKKLQTDYYAAWHGKEIDL